MLGLADLDRGNLMRRFFSTQRPNYSKILRRGIPAGWVGEHPRIAGRGRRAALFPENLSRQDIRDIAGEEFVAFVRAMAKVSAEYVFEILLK